MLNRRFVIGFILDPRLFAYTSKLFHTIQYYARLFVLVGC